jgi:hypothetical protein
VIGGSFLAAVITLRWLGQLLQMRAGSDSLGDAAAFIAMGFGAGFAAGLVAYCTWWSTRRAGRIGYSLTGVCALLAYVFAIAFLIGHSKGKSVMPDSTGSWLLFVLYPACLGAVAGWLRYPAPTPEAESES